jgi:hypothetical protein
MMIHLGDMNRVAVMSESLKTREHQVRRALAKSGMRFAQISHSIVRVGLHGPRRPREFRSAA